MSVPPQSATTTITKTQTQTPASSTEREIMQTESQTQSGFTSPSSSIRPSAGTKRPLMTTTKDGKQLSEKKLRRLEKNRLSARECRRRKREATEDMLRQINVLEGENLRLRLQLQIGEEAEESLKKEQEKVTDDIDTLLKSGASESEIFSTIEDFKEKFADYGRDRRSSIEFHLQNVERLLMPTQTTSVAMRALHGGTPLVPALVSPAQPKLHPTNPNLEPKALFRYLVNYLQVTPQQSSALKDSRSVAKELDASLDKSLQVLKELRKRLTQIGVDLESQFNEVRSILTPTQAAKFLVWVSNQPACMQMLNELWSRDNEKTTAGE